MLLLKHYFMNNNNHLTTAPIPKLIRMIAIPASMGFFFNTMYNIVDTFYAGFISTTAIAALALSFPVFFVIIAMGSGISTGASALIANALGAGEEKKARDYAVQAITFSVIVSAFLTIMGLVLSPWLFRLLGASGEYLSDALSYMNVIFLGTVFFILTFVLNSTLTAQGDTKTFRNWLIIGFFLNIVFDPWFIYGGLGFPALGLPGVAWATVVIQVMGSIYMGLRAIKSGILCRECLKMLKPRVDYFRAIAGQGLPASLNMMTVALGVFIITYFVGKFGSAAVAAYGIATRLDQMAVLPTIGLNFATLTLIGQNNGAGEFERCRTVYRTALKYGLMLVTPGLIIVFILARQLIGFFSHDTAVIGIGVGYLRISVFVYWAYAILYIVVSALQGLKKPLFAVWIGVYRQIAAPVLIFYIFINIFGWKIFGIWWGVFFVNWTASAVSLWYARKSLNALDRPEKPIDAVL
jgi:putative MATE family efflux protein